MKAFLSAIVLASAALVNGMPHDGTAIKYLAEEEVLGGVYNGPRMNATAGAYGIDISSAVSTSAYSCLKGDGFSFAIPRAYQSVGKPDPNACTNIKNAHAGGMSNVDIYIFPCPTCGTSGASQVSSMVNALSSAGCSHNGGTQGSNQWGMIWLDIEGTQYWYSSTSSNQAFYNSMVSQCKSYGYGWGTYSASSQWNPIMGSGFSGGSSGQLWWAYWNGSPCTATMASFGGWSKYNLQQYVGDTTVCGIGIDKDCW